MRGNQIMGMVEGLAQRKRQISNRIQTAPSDMVNERMKNFHTQWSSHFPDQFQSIAYAKICRHNMLSLPKEKTNAFHPFLKYIVFKARLPFALKTFWSRALAFTACLVNVTGNYAVWPRCFFHTSFSLLSHIVHLGYPRIITWEEICIHHDEQVCKGQGDAQGQDGMGRGPDGRGRDGMEPVPDDKGQGHTHCRLRPHPEERTKSQIDALFLKWTENQKMRTERLLWLRLADWLWKHNMLPLFILCPSQSIDNAVSPVPVDAYFSPSSPSSDHCHRFSTYSILHTLLRERTNSVRCVKLLPFSLWRRRQSLFHPKEVPRTPGRCVRTSSNPDGSDAHNMR